ncbi:thiaminase/transcriptional activator TenA [Kineosphaera limosa]|uniref:Putative thiamine metabolism protein n=1 Tax=Kineosphaera limosa NBRC 100340 TaxID=1184609 RepID=K6WNZ9_9MICO|nr:TenA family protein [Kineosphaera limosa]NYD99917.1 thiaminase/transcriptional activator TenA [Kineosphaera limosa]GAB95546.1 putative thiamine metabolism protein [Kineosphaera limosa NBRC 100340]
MSFVDQLWQTIEPIRTAIDELPFVTGLADGSLDADRFGYYMAQDALYLADYGRALAACAAQATDPGDMVFWAESARQTVVVERELHAAHVERGLHDLGQPSPTCTAYTSYLLAHSAQGCYPALAAGVLPCFWIYDDVGTRMKAVVEARGGLSEHPYGDWIAAYGDPEFAASTARAREIVDRLAQAADEGVRQRMTRAFVTAARYEWMFWDAAWRRETWPV